MRRHAKAVVAVSALLLTLAIGATNASAAAPVVAIDPASEIGVTTAQATGEVNPEGKETSWHFEFISDAAYSVHQDAEQTLTVAATAGAYTLSFQGQTTAAIAFSATAATVEGELNALSTIGGVGGSVSVSGGPGDESGSAPYTITFGGSLSETNVEQLSTDPTGLVGSASVETTVQGRSEGFEGATETGHGSFSQEEAEGISGLTAVPPATLEGLAPATEYHLRLVASNADGASEALAANFETDAAIAPTLTVDPASFAYTTATISGEVDPEGGNSNPIGGPVPIAWQLQYALASEPGNWQFGEASTIEGPEAESDPAPGDGIEVSANLSGLQNGSEYDFRLIANYAGSLEAASTEGGFETLPVIAPTVSADEASSVTGFDAHLSGTVEVTSAYSDFDAECDFDYITQAAYEAEGNTFTGASSIPCDPNPVKGSESQPVAVEADAAQLEPDTTYRLRIRASNLGGSSTDEAPATFTTDAVAPTLSKLSHHQLGSGEVVISAFLNPRNSAVTDCHFDYGLTDGYGQSVPCESLPSTDNKPHLVRAVLSGLTPGATYHYRLSATSAAGTSESDDAVLVPRNPPAQSNCPNAGRIGVGFLPNCRAWEMVSPPDKNGGEVIAQPMRTRAAGDGSALLFASLQSFGDVKGSTNTSEYMAPRRADPDPGDNGWLTRGLNPRQEPEGTGGPLGTETQYQGTAPGDLSAGVIRTAAPLTDEPYVEGVMNLYLREDLRGPGASSYRLISECPFCQEEDQKLSPLSKIVPPFFVGASDDFRHVVFESRQRLLAEVGGGIHAYQWDDGSLRLAGILPNGEPAASSLAGSGAIGTLTPRLIVPHAISADGSRTFFTVPEVTDKGALYARVNGRTTFQLNASELASPEAAQPAQFQALAADGSRAFFISTERLTENAPTHGLYMWKQAESDEEQSVAVDATGGTFKLSFNGVSTDAIAFDAPASAVQSALEALKGPGPMEHPVIAPGNVTVSGGPGSPGAPTPYEITFVGDLAGVNVAELSADGSSLSGGAASAMATTTEPVHNLTLLNVDEQPADGPAGELRTVIGASEDGRYVYFIAAGQLVAGAPPQTSASIYLWHEGVISYVGESADFVFNSSPSPGVYLGNLNPQAAVVGHNLLVNTDSGQGLLSVRGGVDADHGACGTGTGSGCQQLYLYKAGSDELACVSCNPSGVPATVDAKSRDFGGTRGSAMATSYRSSPLSDDGRYSFFTTAERLVDEDSNGVKDAYVYDSLSGKPHLLSSGEDKAPSYFLDASADGHDAFFATREALSGWDVDGAYDIYDARIGGGFPEPPPPPPSCVGDACQPPPVALNDPTPSSSSFTGPGTSKNGRSRCRKGQRRVKARNGKSRCVKRNRKQKRDANSNRRAGR